MPTPHVRLKSPSFLMSSMLSSSPISKIDYDVLREIFVHCLPGYALARFEGKRPNITDAPLLLCQICSSWRTVALASARLWSHLYYSFTVCVIHEGDKREYKLLAREVEFLQWWRKNQRAIPPFLRLSVKGGYRRTYVGELAQGGMDFVVEYAASAQYLALSTVFWLHIYKRSEAGYSFVPSKLHTLVRYGGGSGPVGRGLGYHFFKAQILSQPCRLRRISIDEYRFRIEPGIIPIFWSTLTHISVGEIETSLAYWFVLLGGLPKLEWAHFGIEEPREHNQCDPPNSITLPLLSTLYVAMRECEDYSQHVPFSSLFTNVHLPAVRTLSLSWDISQLGNEWHVARELSTILKSAPVVTKLVLAEGFLEIAHPTLAPAEFDAEGHVEPIWKHAAHLTELQLETSGYNKRINPKVWDMLFTEGRWFDLQNMACPVRVVTIADPALAFGIRDSGGSEEAWTASSLIRRKLAEEAPNITFRFTSQSGKELFEKEMEEWDSSA